MISMIRFNTAQTVKFSGYDRATSIADEIRHKHEAKNAKTQQERDYHESRAAEERRKNTSGDYGLWSEK